MYKQAEFNFIEEGIKSIRDKVDFNHPFETIFSIYLVPFVWASHPLLAILLSLLSAVGYGPGEFGSIIDNALGFSKGDVNLSDSNVNTASESIISSLLSKVGLGLSESNSIIYLSKRANRSGMFMKWWMKNRKNEGASFLINVLSALIKTTIKGLIAIGITGGIGAAFRKEPSSLKEESLSLKKDKILEEIPSFTKSYEATDLYANTKGNVEDTLIEFLNKSYKLKSSTGNVYFVFSEMFKQLNGYELRGSKDMEEIISYVDSINSGDPNEKTKFIAPKIEFIAKKLIPTMKINNEKEKKFVYKDNFIDREKLLDALRGTYYE